MKSKFKVGDKVTIISDEKKCPPYLSGRVKEFGGKTFIIEEIILSNIDYSYMPGFDGYLYLLSDDPRMWYNVMFVGGDIVRDNEEEVIELFRSRLKDFSWCDKFLNNVRKKFNNSKEKESAIKFQKGLSTLPLCLIVKNSFIWAGSYEGQEFWYNIHKKLVEKEEKSMKLATNKDQDIIQDILKIVSECIASYQWRDDKFLNNYKTCQWCHKFLNNYENHLKSLKEDKLHILYERVSSSPRFSEIIRNLGFEWENSKEGYDFWENIWKEVLENERPKIELENERLGKIPKNNTQRKENTSGNIVSIDSEIKLTINKPKYTIKLK